MNSDKKQEVFGVVCDAMIASVNDSVWNSVDAAMDIFALNSMYGSVCGSVNTAVYSSVWNSIYGSVSASVNTKLLQYEF